LALGIGLAAALASIVDAILLRPLPVARPSEIFRLFTASESQPLGFVSYPDFEDFREAGPMVAECLIPVSVGDPAQTRLALAVSGDYFQVLGVSARYGRSFAETDQDVVMLAHGTPSDLGTNVRVGAKLYTVVGVAPEGFGLDRFMHADLYLPIHSYGDGKILKDRARRFLTVHVRGRSAKIASVAARLEREHPETNRGRRAVVLDELTARLRTDKMMGPLAGLLSVLAALIFAIACSNACGALLLRGDTRVRETALKMALGASRGRLVGESLREAAGISLVSCALGLGQAWILKEVLRRSVVLPTDFGVSIAARIDWRVLLVAVGGAVAATLVCGVAPALRRVDVWATIKAHERSRKSRARNVLVAVEVTLATALVATGGSLWSGLRTAQDTNLGYQADHISVMTFDPSQIGYNEVRTRAFYRELMERVQELPGVEGVTLAQSVPLGLTGAQKQIRLGEQEEMTVWMNLVTPEYFERMHIGIVQGRTFDDRDGVIVNEELAKRIGAGGKMQVGGRTLAVVGVVKTSKYMRWDEAPRPFLYLPYAQHFAPRMTLHVESSGNVFAAVRKLARDVPASDARALREYFDHGAMFAVKAALRIAAIAGGAGLALALVGLYVMVSSSVTRRRREIGIRVALGARRGAVLGLILRQGMTIAICGTGAGLAGARHGSVLLRSFVPATPVIWPTAYAAAVVVAASAIACSIPAFRALRVDPAVALRQE
jgi:putative ABC transport system permease protein